MVTIHLTGRVTEEGEILFDAPENLPPSDIQITLEIPDISEQFTDEEIKELLVFTPRSGAEVVAAGLVGGWEDKGITDSVAWVDEQRRKNQKRYQW